ncbi:FGGY family carbohydrate kinase [Botrimarina mediterranea]|uniref:ATP:glycerol 3-phosphotransferase n=1 Tax=Botrimarina mediterranea TaxID=2528022 RepID=A0A518K9H4_9BACT|nr:glycerol kinase GlpK [Botrimarina mediterranea]QDV74436.1 Glycerol kinase [Botrimarina mediterranea]QDV79032.1 Glycerol kinase [Planctomycetes bacterium K2D]
MSYLIAIDQSTSATKVLLVDASGAVVDGCSLEHAQHYPQPGWVEHDAAEIIGNVFSAARELCGRHPDKLASVRGVSITNQRETVVVFDRTTGEPLRPAIVWQCRRGDAMCQELRNAGVEPEVAEKTGLRIDSYFSGSKIAWVMREEPAIAEAVRSGAACIGTIDAYLVHRLTSGQAYASDPTNASRTLLYDIGRLAWDASLCERFGVPVRALPEVRDCSATFGETTLGGALPSAAPICGVMGDSQASLFAQCCYAQGDAKATFGSGTSVLVNIGEQFRPAPSGMVGALAWIVADQPTYAWEGLINYSAATLAWLKDQLGLLSSIDDAEALASSVNDSGGVYLVPAFAGMGAPYWKPDARAAILGMSGYTRREHVVRAALESIAFQVADVVEAFARSGAAVRSLRVDGGPTRNHLLMQMVADMSLCELQATDESNLSALGAAMAGMLGLGMQGSLDGLRKLPRSGRMFMPTEGEAEVKRRMTGWRNAVERVF